jgi:hypothetical protein
MTIPVLMVLTSTPSLVSSATGAGSDASGDLPAGVSLDGDFVPIPLALGEGDTLTADVMMAGEAPSFVVRGFIEAELEDAPEEIDGIAIFSDPLIEGVPTCGGDPPVGSWTDVQSLLDTATLDSKGMHGQNVAIAIMDSGMNIDYLTNALGFTPEFDEANSWLPKGASSPAGQWPIETAPANLGLNHGTMCAFDALIAAPHATLIDCTILRNAPPGGSIMAGPLSNAISAFATVLQSWNDTSNTDGLSKYCGLVISNSWGIFHPKWDFPVGHKGRYCDNPRHPFNRILEPMARAGIDVLFAAGNCGADCPDSRCQNRTSAAIMGASAMVDVLSIAGADTNGLRVGYSSQGPSIPGMYDMKPDITSYTHFLGSEVFGTGSPDSGTSAACPVMAGCIAALRTLVSPLSPATPYMVYDHFRTDAKVPAGLSAGWNGDYGYGLVDVVAVANRFNP